MNQVQAKTFHSILSSFVVKMNPYRLSGTRCLIAHEKDIRRAVEKGYNTLQITTALMKMDNTPFFRYGRMLGAGTCFTYVSQIRSELNIHKPKF